MTEKLKEYTERDVYKSLIYILCNFLISKRMDPDCRNLGMPLKIKLREFDAYFEYTNQSTEALKIKEIEKALRQLNEDPFSEDGLTAITIKDTKIFKDFMSSYINNKEIIIGCSIKRLMGYKNELNFKGPTLTKNEIATNKKAEEEREKMEEEREKEKERIRHELEILKITQSAIRLYPDIDLKLEGGKGFIQFTNGGKLIKLGSYETRTFKMTKYILAPNSKSKKVVDVYEHIRINRDLKLFDLSRNTPRAYSLKKDIITSSVIELQKDKYIKGHVLKPEFDDKKKTVRIVFR